MPICGIYCLTSPSGKSYIGQSIDIDNRFEQYKRIICKRQPKIYHAIKKYGFDNFKKVILEECDKLELNNSEVFWINYFNTLSSGYNSIGGGLSGFLCEESRIKISISKKGKKMSPSHKANWMKTHSYVLKRSSNLYWGIKNRKNIFVVDFTENGIEIFKSGFKTKEDAKMWRDAQLNKN